MPTQTAAQRRAVAKHAYNAYIAACPSRQLLATLSDKWITLVLVALAPGSARYADLARAIAGVSQKMLTQTLRSLERDGMVRRKVTPSVPVRVDYSLTPLGRSLLPLVAKIKAWAEAHMDRVLLARAEHDARGRAK